MLKKKWSEWLWDAWCIVSVIGIWPRFIEPQMLMVNQLALTLPQFPSALSGMRILHFSDLHWNSQFSKNLEKKLIRRINSLKADLILFTGDFLCRSKLENSSGLKIFLESLKARVGCFAVLGNHDYADFVTINEQGDYDLEGCSKASIIAKGFKKLFHVPPLTKRVADRVQHVQRHKELIALLDATPFQLLNNTTKLISCKGHWINISGVEDYSLGRCTPSLAFKDYHAGYPGIVLSHNPDSFDMLSRYPGDLILSGHTHGGQVNLPWIWKRLTRLENSEFIRGLKRLEKKFGYINRGISSVMKFRWFAPPELTLITLRGA